MEIKTKLDLGHSIYFMSNNKVACGAGYTLSELSLLFRSKSDNEA